MRRTFSLMDRLIQQAENALRTTTQGAVTAERHNPASTTPDATMGPAERRHAAGLMRINHTGEVCAQALYQGQALTARLPDVRDAMDHAAREEVDHLAWCEARLKELDAQPSLLNPLFYAMSFALGAAAGAVSDKTSLGFVAATEEQVCRHLRQHLETLPPEDVRSRQILSQMLEDEQRHGEAALAAGGHPFPPPVQGVMALMSRVMTKTTYHL